MKFILLLSTEWLRSTPRSFFAPGMPWILVLSPELCPKPMLLSQERVSVPDCSRCVLHAVDGRNAVDHSTMKPFCAAVVQVIKLLYEKTFTRPAPRGADDAPHKSLTNAGAPRAQSAEPRGVAVGMNPRAAAPLGRGDALSYANVDGSSASSRLGRPSSAPHRQDNLLPPTWPGTDVSGH